MALLGLFVWQASSLKPAKAPVEGDAAAAVVANPEQITTENASISGIDNNNRPYHITAKSGQQDKTVETLAHMQDVTGVFERDSGAKLDLTSKTGAFDNKSKMLDLSGNVTFNEGTRFKAEMDQASINTVDQTLQSKSPVKVDMHGTLIEAGSLTVSGSGNRILFKGGVNATFQIKNK